MNSDTKKHMDFLIFSYAVDAVSGRNQMGEKSCLL